jgi:hypothetical protein
MNPELEALVKALDMANEASGEEGPRLMRLYESRLEEAARTHLNLSRRTLDAMVRRAHRDWLRAQRKPSSLPPKA